MCGRRIQRIEPLLHARETLGESETKHGVLQREQLPAWSNAIKRNERN